MDTSTTILAAAQPASSRLLIFVFTDLVDSTGLKERLGDMEYVRCVLQPHNRMFRELLRQYPSALERDNAGDGFFVTFESVAEAVQFALLFQYRLQTTPWELETPQTRIGIHLGDAAQFQDAGTIQTKTAGQAQDLAARLMGLASGRQTLLTRAAFDSARQYVRTHPAVNGPPPAGDGATGLQLQWLAYGRYLLKGNDEPMEVCEVGAVGFAPLRAPADSEKARRAASEVEVPGHRHVKMSSSGAGIARLKPEGKTVAETGMPKSADGWRTILEPIWQVSRRRLWWVAAVIGLSAGAILVWFSTKGPDALVEMRRKELAREVSLLLSQQPLVIGQKPDNYQEVERLDPIDYSPFQILTDSRVIDLRMWKDVPPEKLHERYSAVCLTRRIRLKKIKNAGEYETEARTNGLELYWHCLSPYPFRGVGQKSDVFVGHDRMKARRMVIDVSSVPVGTEFELHTTATYWNSIQTEQEQWFGAIGYDGAFKVSMLLLFPQERPFKRFRMMRARTIRDQPVPYNGPKIVLTGEGQEWLYWEIPSPEDGRVYQLHWDW